MLAICILQAHQKGESQQPASPGSSILPNAAVADSSAVGIAHRLVQGPQSFAHPCPNDLRVNEAQTKARAHAAGGRTPPKSYRLVSAAARRCQPLPVLISPKHARVSIQSHLQAPPQDRSINQHHDHHHHQQQQQQQQQQPPEPGQRAPAGHVYHAAPHPTEESSLLQISSAINLLGPSGAAHITR